MTCDPVTPAGFPDELSDFGAGCSRWLHFAVGGQGALGKTPLWSEVERAQRELSRANLRLSVDEAAQMQPLLGVTHGLVGTLQGTSEQLVLTYHLWQFAPRKEAGEPLTLHGTREQIIAGLPALAATLCARLNVKNPHLPAIAIAPNDMALMGKAATMPGLLYTPALTSQLRALAGRVPLAGMLALRSDQLTRMDTRVTSEISQHLLEQTPDNALAYGQVTKREPLNLLAAGAEIKSLARRFPYNYAVSVTNFYWQVTSENQEEAVRAADRAVQGNIASPYAWVHLSFAMGALSGEDGEERAQAAQKGLQAAQQAVHLDPQNWYLWIQVLRASTQSAKSESIAVAVQKMLALDRGDPDVISWGLNMYSSQGLDENAKRAQVAQHAVGVHYLTAYQSNEVAQMLLNNGFPEQAKAVYARAFAQFRALLAETPNDDAARLLLARGLWGIQRREESLQEYKTLTQQKPNEATPHLNYGVALYHHHLLNEAIGELEIAVRIEPNLASAYALLGLAWNEKREFDKAEPQFTHALRLEPAISEAHFGLGSVRAFQGRYAEAAIEFQAAIDTLRSAWRAENAREITRDSYIHLSEALIATNRVDSALEAAESALQISPENIEALNQLALVYQKIKEWDKSIDALKKALRLKPNDAAAHANMGNALIEKGQRAQARAEWKRVLTLDTSKFAEEARKMLARYPE